MANRFIVTLSETDRAALEKVRIALGLRSHADTIRALVRAAADEPIRRGQERPLPTPKPSTPSKPKKAVSGAEKRSGVDVPYAGDLKRAPMQKTPKGTKR